MVQAEQRLLEPKLQSLGSRGSDHVTRQKQKRGPGRLLGPGRSLNGLLKETFLRAPNVSPELQLGRYKLPNMLPHHAEARLRAV